MRSISINKEHGFSLIELSIVLIIISFLVVSVIGGQSLIENAKVTRFLNEMNNIEKAVVLFQASRGRLPGDTNEDEIIGRCWGNCPYTEEPTSTKFAKEYRGEVVGAQAGPWVDLYLDGLSEFKPEVGSNLAKSQYDYENIRKNSPNLSALPEMFANLFFTFRNFSTNDKLDNFYGITNGIYLAYIYTPKDSKADKKMQSVPATFMQKADLKVDDGNYQGGILRTCCYGSKANCTNTYQNAIDNKTTCDEFIYKLF